MSLISSECVHFIFLFLLKIIETIWCTFSINFNKKSHIEILESHTLFFLQMINCGKNMKMLWNVLTLIDGGICNCDCHLREFEKLFKD